MGTKDKILNASLTLFNELGERNVTTNHIAAHLQMSPGNLYYHFRNKHMIIQALFERYREKILTILELPEGRHLQLQDKIHYLQDVFSALWEYRFFHRDIEHFLLVDSALHETFRQFFRDCLVRVELIISSLVQAGIVRIEKDEVSSVALNIWIIVTSWFSFLHCNLLKSTHEQITPELLQGGLYQVFVCTRPYIVEEHRAEIIALQKKFMPKPEWLP